MVELHGDVLRRDPGPDGERREPPQRHLLEDPAQVVHMVAALNGQRLQLREEAEHTGCPLGRIDRDMSDTGPPTIHLEDAWLLSQRRPPGVAPRVPQPVPLSPVRIALYRIAEPGAQLGAVEVV